MTRFNFVFFMSAVGFAAALNCPAADKTGSPLSSAGITSDGFVSCRYTQARTCTYFSNGGISSGSSDCPDQLSGWAVRREAGTASCPIVDNAGSELQSSTIDDDGFLACGYATSFCTYFLNGGFSSGSSVCPSSADVVDTPPSSTPGVCPPTDNSGGALIEEGTLGTFISCEYETSFCTYFTNGNFDSGSSLCPSSIGSTPVRRRRSASTASCPVVDNAGSELQSSTIDDDGFLACGYATSFCTYFRVNGGFSSGSSVCPASANVIDSDTSTGACPPTDNAGGAFIEEGTIDTFISCEYEIARVCTYFRNGGFDSGSSDCPSSIPNTRSAKFARSFPA
ncbi:hypothetical protein CPB85DRAFT_1431909 [Mucidula mucida]|nr:hypothetical protein CPB85DRAFT_1431909 [Mucidula mucida]